MYWLGHTAYTQTFLPTVSIFWVEKLSESPVADLQRCRNLPRNKNCTPQSVYAFILPCDTDIDLQKGHCIKTSDLLKLNIMTVDCVQWVGHIRSEIIFQEDKEEKYEKVAIWPSCEEEAPAVLIRPEDVCQPKIVLLEGQ